LNHQVVIHYGRIMSNKTFSITPRAWEPAKSMHFAGSKARD